MFEFDVKTAGPSMTFTANETNHNGYNSVFTMSDNAIFEGATYNLHEWKTFRVLFDVDNKKTVQSNTFESAVNTVSGRTSKSALSSFSEERVSSLYTSPMLRFSGG